MCNCPSVKSNLYASVNTIIIISLLKQSPVVMDKWQTIDMDTLGAVVMDLHVGSSGLKVAFSLEEVAVKLWSMGLD